MSDSQPGPGWWQASDGKWYPHEQHPSAAASLPPPVVRPQPTTPPPITPFGSLDGTSKNRPWWRRWWAIAIAAIVALAVVAGIVGNDTDDDQDVATDPTTQIVDDTEAVADAGVVTTPAETPVPRNQADDDPIATVVEDDVGVPPPDAGGSGSRDDPFWIGQPVTIEIDSFGDGDGSVWTLNVDGPGTDLTQAVALENPFNEPPPDGSIFYGVPVSLTLDSANKEPLSLLFNLELEFFGPASLSIIDAGLAQGCGVTPDELDLFKEVFVGGTVSGIVCLAVPQDDVDAGVLLTTDSIDGDRIYFATTGDAVEALPDRQDEGQDPDLPPPVDAAAGPGERFNPYPIGPPITVTLDSFGDGDGSVWTLNVDGPGTDLTQAVALENPFNEPPPDGSIFYGVPVSLTLDSANKEPLSLLFNLELEFFGPASLSIIDAGLAQGCGVTPDELDLFKEVFVGGTVSGIVCLAVPQDDVDAGVLLTTDSIDGDRIYFATS